MNTQASAATAAFLEPHQPPDLAPQPLACGLHPVKKASVSAPLSREDSFMLTSYDASTQIWPVLAACPAAATSRAAVGQRSDKIR